MSSFGGHSPPKVTTFGGEQPSFGRNGVDCPMGPRCSFGLDETHRATDDSEPNRFFLFQLASTQSRATLPSAFTLSKVSSTPFSFAVVLIRSQTALLRMVSKSS